MSQKDSIDPIHSNMFNTIFRGVFGILLIQNVLLSIAMVSGDLAINTSGGGQLEPLGSLFLVSLYNFY